MAVLASAGASGAATGGGACRGACVVAQAHSNSESVRAGVSLAWRSVIVFPYCWRVRGYPQRPARGDTSGRSLTCSLRLRQGSEVALHILPALGLGIARGAARGPGILDLLLSGDAARSP